MKSGPPVSVTFHTGLILPLLPIFLLGAALLTGSKKALVAEAARHDQTERLAALQAAPRGLPYGPFAVTRTPDVLLPDIRRRKDVLVTVTAPQIGGPFPVIVFSHGAGGDGTQNEPLLRWWASNGYVVLSPTHSDSLLWQQRHSDLCDRVGDDSEGSSLGLQTVVHLTMRDPQSGVQRARDVSFVLNSLNTLEETVPTLAGKMDRTHVGVAGNSLGACTAQLVGGASVYVPGQTNPLSFRDRRAQAVLQLSGQGTGQQGITKESWRRFPVPMMVVTGSEDRSGSSIGPEGKREPFDFSPTDGSKYLVVIQGAHSGCFSGRFTGRARHQKRFDELAGETVSQSPPADQKAIFSYVEKATLAFWNMTLKKDPLGNMMLTHNASFMAHYYGVTATISHK